MRVPFGVPAGQEWRIDREAGQDPAYLSVVDKKVARAVASDNGELAIEFTDADHLIVSSDVYEPWQLNGDDGSLIVSVAGGGLAVWNASGDTSGH